jgi:Thiopurine S-methyltransferase (TPMT)
VSATDVKALYAKSFTVYELSRRDILSTEPRMRARGITELHEVCYRLTRH